MAEKKTQKIKFDGKGTKPMKLSKSFLAELYKEDTKSLKKAKK